MANQWAVQGSIWIARTVRGQPMGNPRAKTHGQPRAVHGGHMGNPRTLHRQPPMGCPWTVHGLSTSYS